WRRRSVCRSRRRRQRRPPRHSTSTCRIRPSRFRIFPDPSGSATRRRGADGTDVLTYATAPLSMPVRISGAPVVHLFASTSGTDADWVVKLIDVYPDEVPSQPEFGGYQLAVSLD